MLSVPPEHEGNRFGVVAAVFSAFASQQPIHNNLGAQHGGSGGDGLRIECVNILAGGQHVRVADRVTAGAGENILTFERP